jgi:hypothetical protein
LWYALRQCYVGKLGDVGLDRRLHAGRGLVDRWCAECRSWKTLGVEVFLPHVCRACWCSAHHREPAVCTDQRCSKCSPGIPDTLGLPACRSGGCGGKSVLQCCSVTMHSVCRYWGQAIHSRTCVRCTFPVAVQLHAHTNKIQKMQIQVLTNTYTRHTQ